MDSNGSTPLHVSSRNGHVEVVKLLFRLGADVDARNKANKTAVDLAIENDNARIARFLTGYKDDENVLNNTRSTTLDTAHHGTDHVGMDGGKALLLDAAYEGDLGVVQSLLDQGGDINTRNDKLETLLDLAVCAGKVEMVRLLLERGAEVDPRDDFEWTPLHAAARYRHLGILRVLIDHGANLESRDIHGLTPLHVAAYHGNREVCRTLLDLGANMNARERHHHTPVHFAIQFGHPKVVELLLERVADVSALNCQTPLQVSPTPRLQIHSGSMAHAEDDA